MVLLGSLPIDGPGYVSRVLDACRNNGNTHRVRHMAFIPHLLLEAQQTVEVSRRGSAKNP